jgi:hypothetical protein
MKYDARNPQVMPLSKCEFGENQHEESHILFKGVNKILPASKVFFHKCG